MLYVSDGEQQQEIQDCRATETQSPSPHFNAFTTKPLSFLHTILWLYLPGRVIIAVGP